MFGFNSLIKVLTLIAVLWPLSAYAIVPFTVATLSSSRSEDFLALATHAGASGARLIVLPSVSNKPENIPGKITTSLMQVANRYQTYIAVGMVEIDAVSHLTYQAAVLLGPEGVIGKYRQIHVVAHDGITPGTEMSPVFSTALGKIALVRGNDCLYLAPFLQATIQGANIIAVIAAADTPQVSALAGWLGTYIVDDHGVWDPYGQALPNALIEPLNYQNAVNYTVLKERRPALYKVSSISTANKSAVKPIKAIMLQYAPVEGDKAVNLGKIRRLLKQQQHADLIILPEMSLIGANMASPYMKALAEPLNGPSVQAIARLARENKSYIVFSLVEKTANLYYETALIIDPHGAIIARYPKSHLTVAEKAWATAGERLPVFDTSLGRIALVLGTEVKMPDIAAVYAAQKADIVVIASSWAGEYGGPAPLFMWNNMAIYSHATTFVANYYGSKWQYLGGSGVYPTR